MLLDLISLANNLSEPLEESQRAILKTLYHHSRLLNQVALELMENTITHIQSIRLKAR